MGIPSFRVRGMYLAIVTLAFANAAYAWLFHQRIFNGGRDASRYEPDHLRIGSLDLSDRRTYYLVCLAALGGDRAHGQPAAPFGRGPGARGRARQRGVGRGVHHRPPGDEAVGLRPRRRSGRVRGRAADGAAHQRPGRPVPGRHVPVGRLDGGDRRSGVGVRRRHRHPLGRRAARHLRHQRDGRPAHLRRRAARADHVLPRRPGAGGLRHPGGDRSGGRRGGCPRPRPRTRGPRPSFAASDWTATGDDAAGRHPRPGGARPRRHVRRAADRRRRRPARRPQRGRRPHRRQRRRQDHDHERHRRLRPRRGPRRAARPRHQLARPPPAGPSGASGARSRTPGCSAT